MLIQLLPRKWQKRLQNLHGCSQPSNGVGFDEAHKGCMPTEHLRLSALSFNLDALSILVFFQSLGAQKTTYRSGSDILVPRPDIRGIPEIMVCSVLMFMWSFGP